jgi:dihydrofolate synthase/folylpolyglutamate synthase
VDSGLTTYRAALDALFARTGSTSKFGLERTVAFLEAIGNPHERFPSFHVAGTNGKGSVVATLSALLESKKLRVGRYMSPHLVDFRERIVVDREPVSEEYVVQFLDRWEPIAQHIGATFFEITTAMAFHYFAIREVDVAVIETGLGGRLDSTNVILPLVSGITSIGLDHQEYLGTTEAAIAREKAGIMKHGKPAVIGPLSTEARVAIYEVARTTGVQTVIEAERLYCPRNVHVRMSGTSFDLEYDEQTRAVTTGLIGTAQAANASVAMSMLRAAGSSWAATLEEAEAVLPSVKLPGRFQTLGNIILDVAHNPDGIKAVVATVEQVRAARPITCVLGVLADKDWRGMIDVLGSVVSQFIFVRPPSAPPARAWNPEEAGVYARSKGFNARVEMNFENAIRETSTANGISLITGSFHTVGDALIELGEKTF